MTLEKLESQSHDSERVGDSAVFMGVVTLGEPHFRPFSARNGPIFGSPQVSPVGMVEARAPEV